MKVVPKLNIQFPWESAEEGEVRLNAGETYDLPDDQVQYIEENFRSRNPETEEFEPALEYPKK